MRNDKIAVLLSDDNQKNDQYLQNILYPMTKEKLVLFNSMSYRHSQNVGILNPTDLCLILNTYKCLLDLDNKTYCSGHYNVIQQEILVAKALKEKLEAKQKAKEEAKKAKMEANQKAKEEAKKAKEEANKAKLEAKQKAKEEAKQKAKEEVKENLIYSGCNQIIKSGKNKGGQCNCKIYKASVCKRHYKSDDVV
jgi:vacuolar-type H+-ATPase subunit H